MMKHTTRESMVQQFRQAAGKGSIDQTPADIESIFRGIEEEYAEFLEAAKTWVGQYVNGIPDVESRAQIVKEWADLAYVVSQAAVFFNIPADSAFNRVHNNNMTKVVDGKVILREDGKILKPEGYVPCDMRGL